MADETFSAEVVAQIAAHMNGEHATDSLYIVQAAGHPDAVAARMIDMDADGMDFSVHSPDGTEAIVRVPFGHRLTERAEVRHEVVRLHMDAVLKLAAQQRRG